MSQYDCIIIGGGVSGLTAGAYFARANLKTLVLEKNDHVGGCAGSFFRDGYTFDVGGFPQYDQIHLLRDLGVEDRVQFISMGDPAIAMFFPEVTALAPKPLNEFLDQFKGVTSEQARSEAEKAISTMLSINMDKFMKLNKQMSSSKIKFIGGLLTTNPIELMRVMRLLTQDSTSWLKKRISDEQILEYICYTYSIALAFPCVRMPAFLASLIMSGFVGGLEGRWHQIIGGNINFSLALVEAIEMHGGEVRTDSSVEKVLLNNGTATGVKLINGEEISAKHIISASGIRETIEKLVGKEHFNPAYTDKIMPLKPTPSMFKVSLGINKRPDLPAPINFKICDLNQAAWWQAIDEGVLPDKPPFMLLCKALNDPSMAPEGKYDIDVLVPAPNYHRDGDWDTVKQRERDKVMAVINEMIPGIEEQIEFEWVFTPKDYEQHLGQQGGGWLPFEPSTKQMMKIPDMDIPVNNLYCIGSSVKGGAGINAAADTGKRCAQKIIRAMKSS